MIKKTTLTAIALFFCLSAFSQIKVTQTTFNGETYNIYPVRLPFGFSHRLYSDYLSFENEYEISYSNSSRVYNKKLYENGLWVNTPYERYLPYNPFELPDGKYLAYYKKRESQWDPVTYQPIYTHEDTTLVAVTFTLKNNKKNGACTWYDLGKDRHILQECNYTMGIKDGTWKLYREKSTHEYTYNNGERNGTFTIHKDGYLYSTMTYVKNSLNGERIEYYPKSDLPSEYNVYNFGKLMESKRYTRKGELTYWYNRDSKDGIYSRSYKKGVVTEENFWVDSMGLGKTIKYYENGNKKSEYVLFYSDVYSKYHKRKYGEDYPWEDFMDLADRITPQRHTIAYKEYHENGKVAIELDVRKDSLFNPFSRYDEEGRIVNTYVVEPLLWRYLLTTKSFDPKTGRLKRESYKTQTYGEDGYRKYDKNGNLVRFRLDQDFLGILYRDSIGLVQSGLRIDKKEVVKYYTLLHADDQDKFSTRTYKGEDFRTLKTRTFVEDSMPKTEVIWSEFDKNKEFELRHTMTFVTPHVVNKDNHYVPYLWHYYNNISHEEQGMRAYKNELDYQIFYKGKPLDGQLSVHDKRRSKPFSYKMKYRKKASKKAEETVLDIKDFSNTGGSYYCNLQVFGGYVSSMRKSTWMSNTVDYSDNLRDGETWSYCGGSENYVNGKRHGLYSTSNTLKEYYHGKLHGDYIDFGYYSPEKEYHGQIDFKASYKLDTLHGMFQSFVRPMELSQTLYFENGLPNGKYWRGNVTAPTSVDITLDHGYLVDTAYYYFKEGVLKTKVYHDIKDSVFFDDSYKNQLGMYEKAQDSMRKYTDWNQELIDLLTEGYLEPNTYLVNRDKLIDFDAKRSGDYVYYYKNGQKASEGRIEASSKVGIWRYWDLSGGLYKEVTYDSGWFVNPITQDSTYYYGRVKMWYPNGKELLTGLILSKFERFQCDQEMKVDFENLYYLTFHNREGELTLTNRGGKVYEYHNNSEIRLEGEMANGKRSGLWKFYNPQGRLEEVGRYDNGKKDGLWVSGDLEAVPYFEDMCMDGEVGAYEFPDLSETGAVTQPIRIKESLYDKGRYIDSDHITLHPLY